VRWLCWCVVSAEQVTLGWAWADSHSFEVFAREVAGAPVGLRPALGTLCELYGLARLEAGADSYLAAGGPLSRGWARGHGLGLHVSKPCYKTGACDSMRDPLFTGALSGDALRALRLRVNALCRQLGADGARTALALCDGFGIPDELLQASTAAMLWLRHAACLLSSNGSATPAAGSRRSAARTCCLLLRRRPLPWATGATSRAEQRWSRVEATADHGPVHTACWHGPC
jgi:hypothetical protein